MPNSTGTQSYENQQGGNHQETDERKESDDGLCSCASLALHWVFLSFEGGFLDCPFTTDEGIEQISPALQGTLILKSRQS